MAKTTNLELDANHQYILKQNIDHIIDLVVNQSNRSDREKSILHESLLYLNLELSKYDIKEASKVYNLIVKFNSQFDIVPMTAVGDFATYWSEDGYYYFKFNSANDVYDRPILKDYLRSEGFVWQGKVKCRHGKKRTIGQNYDTKLFVNICLNRAEQDEKLKQ